MHFRKEKNRLLKRQEGVVALEFVVLFPLFLLIIAGIVEFGHLFYVRHTLTNASREGARAAVVYTTNYGAFANRETWAEAEAVKAAKNYLGILPDQDPPQDPKLPGVSPSVGADVKAFSGILAGDSGSMVTVTITASNVLVVVDQIVTLSNPITVTAETTMRLE